MIGRVVSRHRGAGRGAAGSTLIEVLAALVLMGTSVIVLVTGMGTIATSTSQNRQSTTASVVARDYAEALVLAVAQTGAWCSPSYTVGYTPPAGYTVGAALGACPTDSATPQFQTATISVGTLNGSTEQLKMVVRSS